jgi:predicted AlkP superfamily phosphohydrolase/phosphomutase
VTRRGLALVSALALGAVASGAMSCGTGVPAGVRADHRLVVLGIDGMDPGLLRQFIDEGRMPHFAELARRGAFLPLGTSTPPQSPVAWSEFITGTDAGSHGIFDFIALDRAALAPRMSTADVVKTSRAPLRVGDWCIPLGSDETRQLRQGQAFWEILEQAGVPATLVRIPANYPPVPAGQALAGMGTPDLLGTSGTFGYYTDDPAFVDGPVSGGAIHRVRVRERTVRARLEGPANPLRCDGAAVRQPFTVYIDAENPAAVLRIGGEERLLRVGEWSDWIGVEFALHPWLPDAPALGVPARIRGIVRFYLKELAPHFRLYASPLNVDPGDPALAIATPPEYAHELYESVGPFYTEEMPEDSKALSAGVLDPREFVAQSGLVLDEATRMLEHELERFLRVQKRGLLFFYVSSLDQRSHMLWRERDPEHPFHVPDTPADLADAVRRTYAEVDGLLGRVVGALDSETALLVMSDHGFASFRRQAHLNAWLEQHGYLALREPAERERAEWLDGIDWSRTRAFAIGLNSLYLNVRGRERAGIVAPEERAALAREIAAALEDWTDPERGGAHVVSRAALREDVYHGPLVERAPDVLVGYASGYRASWDTTSAKVPEPLLADNDREWSGDHCMDARAVPGVLLSSRPLRAREANLRDLTVSILADFGLAAPPHMQGRSIF